MALILIVVDDPQAQSAARTALEAQGHEVVVATGAEARARAVAPGPDQDESPPREAELARREAELRELAAFHDDMIATMVHDLKSPLAVLLPSLDYALGQPAVDGEVRLALEDCLAASTQLARLVAGTLDAMQTGSQRRVLRPRAIPLPRLLDDVLTTRRPLLEREEIELDVDVGPVAIAGERALLVRILGSVLDHVFRDTPARGRVRVWASVTADGIELRTGRSGLAIPERRRATAFDPVDRGGLGLHVCRLAAEALGGRIWIEESPDLPAIVALSMPIP